VRPSPGERDQGTLQTAVETCAAGLVGGEEQIKDALRGADVRHNDETGGRVQGDLQGVQVTRTARLTHEAVHPKRGRAAMTEIGLLPAFHGVSVHDGLTAYRQEACAPALCNAHHLRALTAVEEHDQQPWATRMKDLRGEIKARVDTARAQGDTRVDPPGQAAFVARDRAIVAEGYAANPPPTRRQPAANPPPTRRQPAANPSPTRRQPVANPSPAPRRAGDPSTARLATSSIGCTALSRRSWPS